MAREGICYEASFIVDIHYCVSRCYSIVGEWLIGDLSIFLFIYYLLYLLSFRLAFFVRCTLVLVINYGPFADE